ncbi:MAG: hypothetical protein F6K45_23165 [Kamptonema sp. SIO1D9]|nr:hypothetical protein [Kamptonema sp. SIO1D9]
MVFSSYKKVGFSGARTLSKVSISALEFAYNSIPFDASICIGCADGVDKWFRSRFPDSEIFRVGFAGRGGFAERSIRCVDAVRSGGGAWISFPDKACPVGLLPSGSSSRCFSGFGSGTWASLAYAVGSGVDSFVFLGSIPVPSGWDLSPVSGCPGWFCRLNRCVQLSLF